MPRSDHCSCGHGRDCPFAHGHHHHHHHHGHRRHRHRNHHSTSNSGTCFPSQEWTYNPWADPYLGNFNGSTGPGHIQYPTITRFRSRIHDYDSRGYCRNCGEHQSYHQPPHQHTSHSHGSAREPATTGEALLGWLQEGRERAARSGTGQFQPETHYLMCEHHMRHYFGDNYQGFSPTEYMAALDRAEEMVRAGNGARNNGHAGSRAITSSSSRAASPASPRAESHVGYGSDDELPPDDEPPRYSDDGRD
ncbi:uncharacterized protein F4822DRAFT_252495 [Hypoxylon trugodes]|uniref:uncharacterized protein n=1 Tax=Hypoxylon trugodes TaxID=326681 RepID=UPI0021921A37|nr:uncharacterized protein F4822DRAFT_252495 [Hypoxylon trugodes]KAI1388649.1 hypothetical protein F4822DRAFT_252495 [Hypoxylon trugodes]